MSEHFSQHRDDLLTERESTVKANGHNDSNKPTAHQDTKALLAQLAVAAENGNAQAFVTAYSLVDWHKRTANEFKYAIQWALSAGAHLAARSLAATGAAQYPDHDELQKAARILAPPKVLRRALPAEPAKRANHQWLQSNHSQYRGQWVALRNGQLLAAADSFQALTNQQAIVPDILFTKVV